MTTASNFYSVDVSAQVATTSNNISTTTNAVNPFRYYDGGYGGTWQQYPYTYYTYPYWSYPSFQATIYKYQIICPRCHTNNWLELDKITMCTKTKCGAKLKAVINQADYEVPVVV